MDANDLNRHFCFYDDKGIELENSLLQSLGSQVNLMDLTEKRERKLTPAERYFPDERH